jgi:branched-chain amino acid transport system permease protein
MQQFINLTLIGLTQGAIFAAFALSLVLIWRSTRIVNFGQGAMAMFTTLLALEFINAGWSYWAVLPVALVAGFLLGALVERLIIRPVATGPEINPVIVTLGLFIFLVALAAILFGSQFQSYPPAAGLRGFQVGDVNLALTPNGLVIIGSVIVVMLALLGLFQFTNLGLQMRASAFSQEVSRLLGVRVNLMLTLGWALAGLVGSLSGILIASGSPAVFPGYMDAFIVYGFVAAVIGGLDSPIGAVVGGLILGLTLAYVAGYLIPEIVTLAALVILMIVLIVKPGGLFSSATARRV